MKRNNNVVLSRLLVGLLVTAMVLSSMVFAFANETDEVVITILHTNDIHSRVLEGDRAGMGYAKLATLANQIREETSNALLMDAGDTFHGENIANLVEGASIVSIMNTMNYDVMVAGNHDFNFGQERLLELDEMANFPVLGANVLKEDGTPFLQEYVIFEIEDVKIGVFGLASTETSFKTHPNNVVGLTFADPVEISKTMVEELEDEVDVIIALAHLGEEGENTSVDVATAVEGIDLIVDGHSHSVYETGNLVNDVLIVSAGEHAKYLGVVELKINNGVLVERNAKLISKEEAAEIEGDAEVTQLIEEISAEQDEILHEIIASTSVDLDGERENVRTRETNLGNLVVDAFLAETNADVALTNGGGIRSSIAVGDITKGDVIGVVPFTNFVITKHMTGETIKEALEFSVRLYPEANGGFLQVAGLTFDFDPSKEEGERVDNVMIAGEPLDTEKVYVVATHDFLAAGGDGYEMFLGTETVNEYPVMNEVVMDYIAELGEITIAEEGRINIVEAVEEVEVEEEIVEEIVEEEIVEEPVIEEPIVEEPVEEVEVIVYIVQPGDWLSTIAMEYDTTWEALQELNDISNPNLIFPGQEIVIQK